MKISILKKYIGRERERKTNDDLHYAQTSEKELYKIKIKIGVTDRRERKRGKNERKPKQCKRCTGKSSKRKEENILQITHENKRNREEENANECYIREMEIGVTWKHGTKDCRKKLRKIKIGILKKGIQINVGERHDREHQIKS